MVLDYEGDTDVPFLERLALRVFPNVMWVTLEGEQLRGPVGSLDGKLLQPLAAVSCLELLHICADISLSTCELVQLCGSLARLTDLEFMSCRCVDLDRLVQGVGKLGRKMRIGRVW